MCDEWRYIITDPQRIWDSKEIIAMHHLYIEFLYLVRKHLSKQCRFILHNKLLDKEDIMISGQRRMKTVECHYST